MTNEEGRPSKAEILASLITGNGNQSHAMATVQRSHRFPLHLFVQMENLAKHANVPVSLIINELIECGLDALKQELPEEVAQKVSRITKDQTERPTITERFDSEKYRGKISKKE
jgi:predicted DNA-binding protein